MLAKVLDVGDDTIYLEVDDQIRFTSKYVMGRPLARIAKNDSVVFEFIRIPTDRRVIINKVLS